MIFAGLLLAIVVGAYVRRQPLRDGVAVAVASGLALALGVISAVTLTSSPGGVHSTGIAASLAWFVAALAMLASVAWRSRATPWLRLAAFAVALAGSIPLSMLSPIGLIVAALMVATARWDGTESDLYDGKSTHSPGDATKA